MKKIILTISISIITIIILLSFIDTTPQQVSNNTADIVYSINSIPTNLKSIGDLDKRQQDIVCATSKGLVEIDSEGNIQPALAESYEINDDGLEYVFKIRNDAYWSNGDKITPEDIVSFFREVITEDNEISALLNVYGVKDYLESDKSFSEAVAITSDENSIKIRLNSKDDGFIEELTKPQYRLRKDVLFWEDIALNYKDIPYSGDYCIDSISETEVILKRSDKASVELAQTIHLVKDESEDLALAAFEIGSRDIVINPPKSQLERLKTEGKLIESPSNEALYLAFNVNNSNFSNEVKNEIYRLVNEAIEEYQNQNNILVELAECSYFREDKEDITKLQSRNVMVNTEKEITMPSKIVLVAQESLENKDITSYITNWFKNNTETSIVVNLLSEDDMNLISEKNYYDIALVNVYAKLDDDEQLLNTISSFIPKDQREMINNSNSKAEKEELFSQIEEDLFNNYRILPLLFYNNTIAVDSNVDSNILDGNGNIDFKSIKQ
ncbi:ABC transporter substrate-binding protein [Clostridium sp.]|uniref:ABC transporter substrate-binding protein n=1 Tax=Clostridium sp. TaxID=1506 RepID=UPI002633278D|nr:ABC transporter substrate-binding protein [Clostridium sp.]